MIPFDHSQPTHNRRKVPFSAILWSMGFVWGGLFSGIPEPLGILGTLGDSPQAIAAETSIALKDSLASDLPGQDLQQQDLEQQDLQQQDLQQHLAQGQQAYRQRRFSEALQFWQQGLQQTPTGTLDRCIFLNNLSLVYQQFGQWSEAENTLQTCQALLDSAVQSPQRDRILVQNLTNHGSLLLRQGEAEQALPYFEAAETILAKGSTDTPFNPLWLENQINQVQALQAQGLNRLAQSKIEAVAQAFETLPPSALKAAGLRSWGETLALIGDPQQGQTLLEKSLSLAQSLGFQEEEAQTLMSLANVLGKAPSSSRELEKVLELYETAATTTIVPSLKVQAKLNRARVLLQFKQYLMQPQTDTTAIQTEIETLLATLPPSRLRTEAYLNFAKTLLEYPEGKIQTGKIAQMLTQALQEARASRDQRSQSYALGTLAQLYQQDQRWSEAQVLTEEALNLAIGLNADDIAYEWEWQLAQLLTRQGKNAAARLAYEESIQTLNRLQQELVSLNPDARFSFREGVEPLYREFVAFLLQNKAADGKVPQSSLVRAQQVMESLQLAELVNFFRSNCLQTEAVDIDQLDDRSAVIYPIVLPNSLEILVNIPGQGLRHYSVDATENQLRTGANLLRSALITDENTRGWQRRRNRNDRATTDDRPLQPQTGAPDQADFRLSGPITLARRFYDWVIRPIEADLTAAGVETLVLVPDGPLRNIPASVFYDRETDQFLLEKYSIALTPGLQLLGAERLADRPVEVLIGGLTEAVQGFAPLPSVAAEIKNISAETDSFILFNDKFSQENIATALRRQSYPVVHLATHGQFSSNADQTFVLTWDDNINVNELSELLRSQELNTGSPIELLILSACETAAGDDRAALGLAGVAVRAGARSTMATLWVVDDEGTSLLMSTLYDLLSQRNASKAEVLRQAQLKLLNSDQFSHPFYWAPFVLVGNWL